MKKGFLDFLESEQVIIADGGIVTALYDKGFYINRSFEELCLTDPQSVREVVQSYKNAGAQVLKTNTFSAVVPKLTEYGLQEQLEQILEQACRITASVANSNGYVFGVIGPLGVVVEPLGPTSLEEAQEYFARNVRVFDKEEVDVISFMGFHDLRELESGLIAARKFSKKPLSVQVGIQESMKTSFGNSLEEFVALCDKYDVEVLGVAGEVGPSGTLTALQKLKAITSKPIYVSPNAGLPRYVNDQYVYMCNPDYIGKYAKRFAQAGAKIIGGHSGVHEPHIQAIQNSVRMARIGQQNGLEQMVPVAIQAVVDEPQKPVSLSQRSRLGQYLAEKKPVVSVEVIPPRGVEIQSFLEHCRELEKGGVEFINIPDGARAMARMSSIHLSSYIQRNFNLEPIPHFTTRDRNLIGLQSDLLGAYVNDVRNILVITGDPPKLGNCPGATAVYDVDAIGLTHILNRMNQGLDLGGSSFGEPSQFLVGVALNPTTPNRELEIRRFKYKVEAGANFAITQPIYSLEAYQDFFAEMGPVDIPIIMGIWPLVSLRNAEFLRNEVPGVDVPDWVIDEMKTAGDDKEKALQTGVDIAIRTINEAQGLVAGFQISAPFNRVDVAVEVIKATRSKEAVKKCQ